VINARMIETSFTSSLVAQPVGHEPLLMPISVMCDPRGVPVTSYDDLVDLARMCRNQANVASRAKKLAFGGARV